MIAFFFINTITINIFIIYNSNSQIVKGLIQVNYNSSETAL